MLPGQIFVRPVLHLLRAHALAAGLHQHQQVLAVLLGEQVDLPLAVLALEGLEGDVDDGAEDEEGAVDPPVLPGDGDAVVQHLPPPRLLDAQEGLGVVQLLPQHGQLALRVAGVPDDVREVQGHRPSAVRPLLIGQLGNQVHDKKELVRALLLPQRTVLLAADGPLLLGLARSLLRLPVPRLLGGLEALVLEGVKDHIPHHLHRGQQLVVGHLPQLAVGRRHGLALAPVGPGDDVLQLPLLGVGQPHLAPHHRAQVGVIQDQRHGEVHQVRVAAVDVGLAGDGGVEPAVGVALLAQLGEALELPAQGAVVGEAAVLGDGPPLVVHGDEGQPHGLGALVLDGLDLLDVHPIG